MNRLRVENWDTGTGADQKTTNDHYSFQNP